MKRCSTCTETKPLSEFHRNRSRPDGRAIRCIPCSKEANAARYRRRRDRDPEGLALVMADRRLRARHGISLEQRDLLLAAQGGACAICGTVEPNEPWHVDHDHACCVGRESCGSCIRAILCGTCNRGLGQFKDDPVLLQRAIEYVQQHKKEITNV